MLRKTTLLLLLFLLLDPIFSSPQLTKVSINIDQKNSIATKLFNNVRDLFNNSKIPAITGKIKDYLDSKPNLFQSAKKNYNIYDKNNFILLQFIDEKFLEPSHGCSVANFFFGFIFSYFLAQVPRSLPRTIYEIRHPKETFTTADPSETKVSLLYLFFSSVCWIAFNTNCYRFKIYPSCTAWRPFFHSMYPIMLICLALSLLTSASNFFDIYRQAFQREKKTNEKKTKIETSVYFTNVNSLPEQQEQKKLVNGKEIDDEQNNLLIKKVNLDSKPKTSEKEENAKIKTVKEKFAQEKTENKEGNLAASVWDVFDPPNELTLEDCEKTNLFEILFKFSVAPKLVVLALLSLMAIDALFCGTTFQ